MLKSIFLFAAAALWTGCGTTPAPSPVAEKVLKAKPADESRRFPQAHLVESKVVDDQLLGKTFMPGGTLAHYKDGVLEYDLFLAKTGSPTDAALLLLDWSKALAGSKLVPAFGGYFGDDAGRPVFVFAKGSWIAGIAGLSEKQADGPARLLANRIE